MIISILVVSERNFLSLSQEGFLVFSLRGASTSALAFFSSSSFRISDSCYLSFISAIAVRKKYTSARDSLEASQADERLLVVVHGLKLR